MHGSLGNFCSERARVEIEFCIRSRGQAPKDFYNKICHERTSTLHSRLYVTTGFLEQFRGPSDVPLPDRDQGDGTCAVGKSMLRLRSHSLFERCRAIRAGSMVRNPPLASRFNRMWMDKVVTTVGGRSSFRRRKTSTTIRPRKESGERVSTARPLDRPESVSFAPPGGGVDQP